MAAVLPYFRRVEDDPASGEWHGAGGPIRIRRFSGAELHPVIRAFIGACTRAGHRWFDDQNAPGAVGVGPLPVNQLGGIRQSTAVTYLTHARERPNFELRASVMVDRVEVFDGRAAAVVLSSGERIAADVVVLCAGAIGSPAILQRSGIGPAAVLHRVGIGVVHRLEGVGRNLREHPIAYPTWRSDSGGGSNDPPLQVLLACDASGARGGNSIELNIAPLSVSAGAITLAIPLVRPYAVGGMELESADPDASPRLFLNLYGHLDDLRRAVSAIRIVRSLAASPDLRQHLGDELWPGPGITTDAAIADALPASPAAGAHVAGTCSMGPPGAAWAVVDQSGEVHGL